MATYIIKRGLNLPIAGKSSGAPVQLEAPKAVAYTPTEFRGIIPKPVVKAGQSVKRGTPLFVHKRRPELVFLSPVAGVVREIVRGHRRVVTEIIVDVQGDEAESFKRHSESELAGLTQEAATELLLASGLWASLRTRPLNNIADPSVTPQSILVSGMETGPLMPGPDLLIGEGEGPALEAGLQVLKAITNTVHFTHQTGRSHPAFSSIKSAQVHTFSGPHPAGDATVQINLVDPPRGSNQVWWLEAWEVVLIGRFVLEGAYPAERIYSVVGLGAKTPRNVRSIQGAPLAHLVGETQENVRWIRGSVLTGDTSSEEGWASTYRPAVHVLPATVEREVMGWLSAGLGKFSFSKTFLSGFGVGEKTFDLRPGVYGGHRAIIPFGGYEKVIATPGIEPQFLFRSIIAGDLEDALELGLLDISEEEAALMTYLCPSKNEYDVLLREALEFYEREN